MIPYSTDKKKRREEQTPLRTASQATPVLRTTSQTASAPVANITNTTPPPAVEPLATVQPQFTSMHQDELGRLYDEIQSKSGFNYNPSGDPLWAQAVASTMAQGQRAMRDTMGQAAALTGGYGSSYAQNVGQQAYNQLIEGLMAQAPQFEDAARARHSAELDSLYQQYAMLQDKEQSDYNRWLDNWEMTFKEAQARREHEETMAKYEAAGKAQSGSGGSKSGSGGSQSGTKDKNANYGTELYDGMPVEEEVFYLARQFMRLGYDYKFESLQIQELMSGWGIPKKYYQTFYEALAALGYDGYPDLMPNKDRVNLVL